MSYLGENMHDTDL